MPKPTDRFLVAAVTLCLLLASGCRPGDTTPAGEEPSSDHPPASPAALPDPDQAPPAGQPFWETTERDGLPTAEGDYPDGALLTPEITPGGVALFDFDGDGRLDIYQVRHAAPAPLPHAFRQPAPNRLFRQTSGGRFVEVPDAGGLADAGYGHGAAVGDIDNDGDPDLFVTNYGPNTLFRNNGDGTFTDVTEQAGLASDGWSSAAAFFDFDRDGDLDLFEVNFAEFDAELRCGVDEPEYCGPHTFPGLRDRLYRNQGDGTFVDVGADAGIDAPGRGWGVICCDLTGDDWPDIYVANDEEPNQLWVNNQDGTFFDEAVLRGVAFNGYGRVEASMGVTVGDLNGDETLDFFMTHIASETNTLYVSERTGQELTFQDGSATAGTAGVDLPFTGWGCGLFDFDHDGDLDLAVANGRVARGPVHPTAKLGRFWNAYAEPNLLFRNEGHGSFIDISGTAGSFCSRAEVTRGLAFGDLDNDGDLDLVTCNLDNTLRVFRNQAPPPDHHWLMVEAITQGRAAIGAQVIVDVAGTRRLGVVLRSYSYLASNDPRVHFGLGLHTAIDAIEVHWPDGQRERFDAEGVDRVVRVEQGTGTPQP